jgi:hypothetical protein
MTRCHNLEERNIKKKSLNSLILKTDKTPALSDKSVHQESSCTEGLNV